MVDPLAEVVSLLQPRAGVSKLVGAAGQWCVRRPGEGLPFYAVMLEGSARLQVGEGDVVTLREGDFVLIPAVWGFHLSGAEPPPPDVAESVPTFLPSGEVRFGPPDLVPEVRYLVGHCTFDSPDAALLVSLLPHLVHVRDEGRLATLVQLVRDEWRGARPARDVVLMRLLEVLLIEALRSTTANDASPGLLRGLADVRLAAALRRMHERPTEPWTVARLAHEAALSRSAFFERFTRAVGVAPMEYLLGWRMALAKTLLRKKEGSLAEVAERVGYSSASTFSVAFTRHVGLPPGRYVREWSGCNP